MDSILDTMHLHDRQCIVVSGTVNGIFLTIEDAINWIEYMVGDVSYKLRNTTDKSIDIETTDKVRVIDFFKVGDVYGFSTIIGDGVIIDIVKKLVRYQDYSL